MIAGICLGLAIFFGWYARRVPLELYTDEEMIAYLQAHRAEFEEVIRLYRTFVEREHSPELSWPTEEQGTQGLEKRLGLRGVDYIPLFWLPDPYTLATAQRARAMFDTCLDALEQWHLGGNSCLGVKGGKTREEKRQLAMDCQKAHLPPPKCRLLDYQYSVLRIKKTLRNKAFFAGSWRYFAVWKDYLHFPEPPRIEQGYLLGPMRTDGTYSYKVRVFSSLNYYPPDWKEYECVHRPIDAHWFLRLCNGH